MNVLIVGDNALNPRVEHFFADKGCTAIPVRDSRSLRSLTGEAGGFRATLKDRTLEAGFVVVTEQPASAPADIDGGAVHSLYEEDKLGVLEGSDRLAPVVFLLDYTCESPMAATIRALADATELAANKRRVYYLARFVRTAGHGVETRYRDARNAGVTFVKYEDLAVSYNDDTEEFTFRVSDGVLDTDITAKAVFADGAREVGETFARITKKLGLTPDAEGFLVEDRHFLTPVKTSRRGVYHLGRDLAAERLEDGLNYIWSSVDGGDREEPALGTAAVDGEKCVLCYSCYRACPHSAMEPDTAARVMRNLSLACEGCGICASVCPGNAITLEKQDAAQAVSSKTGKTLALCCENSAALAVEEALPLLGELAAAIETRTIPCGGSVGLEELSGALQAYDKVLVAVCMDDACKHFDGNKRACRQAARLSDMMDSAGLDGSRVRYTQASHAMPGVLRDELAGFVKGEAE